MNFYCYSNWCTVPYVHTKKVNVDWYGNTIPPGKLTRVYDCGRYVPSKLLQRNLQNKAYRSYGNNMNNQRILLRTTVDRLLW